MQATARKTSQKLGPLDFRFKLSMSSIPFDVLNRICLMASACADDQQPQRITQD